MLAFTRMATVRPFAATLVLALAGCASWQRSPALTEADFMTIKPGMTRSEVEARFGRPNWVFRVRQEDMTILNYRYNPNDCIIYQVSILPNGIVHDAGTGNDPRCDGPDDSKR
jgi:hypothetical protein